MKDFNLDRAMAGDAVVDNSGCLALYLTTVVNRNVGAGHYFKLRAGTDYEEVCGFDDKGRQISPTSIPSLSLFLSMAPVKKTVWINVWANGYGIILSSPKPFESEKLARDAYTTNSYQEYYGSHPIEIEI